MDKAGQTAFIASAADPAKQSEQRTGVPASVTIAQAILESGWGVHHMDDANNYFGIKAQEKNGTIDFGTVATGSVDKLTKEFDANGQPFTIVAHFRAYKDMAGSFIDHGLFLGAPRYKSALDAYKADKDANEFARGLQSAGYATDPNYAATLISLMTAHNLFQFNA
jgi:flagellar protein FlgJ